MRGSFDAFLHSLAPGVGKTCLLLRYANDSFSPTFITTIGKRCRCVSEARLCPNREHCLFLVLRGAPPVF